MGPGADVIDRVRFQVFEPPRQDLDVADAKEFQNLQKSATRHDPRYPLHIRVEGQKTKGLRRFRLSPWFGFEKIGGANRDRTGDLYNAIVKRTDFPEFTRVDTASRECGSACISAVPERYGIVEV